MAKKVIKGNDLIEDNVFSNFIKQAKEAESVVESLTAALKILPELAKQIKASTPKGAPTDTKGIKELEELQRKSNEVAKAKLSIDKELVKEKLRLQETNKNYNKTLREELALENKELGTLPKLTIENARLRAERDKLNLSTATGTKRLKEINAQLDKNNATIDASSDKMKKQKLNVGNYGSALEGLKVKFSSLIGIASQFGLALGGVAIVKGAIDTVRVYEDAIADLSAITGATGKDLDFFKNKSIELGVNVKGGASAVVEAYKLIASAKPELLENADALNSVTEAAILLSKASGMELPDAATALTDAMNQFGAGADQAGKFVDVLAAGAKFGSAEIPQITEALLKFGAVAKTTNVNIQESTGLIEALAEKGLKGAEAGTALRNVMLKLSAPDALPKEAQDRMKALGINFDALKDKSKPFSERLEALKPLLTDNAALIKVFGTENAVAATTLLTSTDRIKELTASVDENGVALEQQNAKSKTLSEAFNRLKETWNGFILNLSNGTGAASGLSSALDFLANNLGTILKVAGQLIKVWITYIAVTKALKLRESALEWNNNRKAIKDTGSALKDSTGGAKAFGSAMKGIGFAVAIQLALELALAFYDIASGAAAAREAQKRFDDTIANSAKNANARVEKRQSKLNAEIADLQRLRNENKITEGEFLEMKQKSIDKTNEQIRADIRAKQEAKVKMAAELGALQAKFKVMDEAAGRDVLTDLATGNIFGLIESGIDVAELDELNDQLTQVRANIKGADEKISIYRNELKGTGETLKDVNSELVVNNNELTDNNDKLTKLKKSAKDVNIEYDKLANATEINAKWLNEFNEALSHTLELLDNSNDVQVDVKPEDVLGIEAYEKAHQRLEIILLNSSKTQEEIDRELLEFEIENLEARMKLLQSWGIEDLELEKEVAEKKRQLLENSNKSEVDLLKQRHEAIAKALEITEDLFTKQIDARIAKLQEEMDMAKKRSDLYSELAANGNITAAQSLAEQDRIIAESEIRKAEEEKRKQQILIVTGILQAYNSNLAAGDNSTTAFTKAITSTELLKQFVSALPAFYEGADNVGEALGSPLLPGRDGHIIRVDGNERILNPMQNKAIGDMANDEVVRRVQMSKAMEAGNMSTSGWSDIGVLSQLNGLKSEMRDIKQAIIDKPVPFAEIGAITQKSFEIREGQRSPKHSTSRTFKVQR